MILDDRELLERWVSQRDAEAFKSLAKRYADMVFATSRRILRNDTDAEDVVQECFVTLIRSGSKPASYLGPWLHRVATNTSLKRLRAERRRRTREDSYTREQSPSPDSTLDDALALVDQAIAELPEKQRLAIVAYFLEDRTHEAIAEAMGITRPGVAYRIQKGIESIRKSLKRSGAIISVAALSTALSEQTAVAAPHSLNAALGKLALGGTDAAAYGTSTSAMAKTLGGLVAMKMKVAVVVALVALVAAGVVWFSLGNDSETVPPAAPFLESESSEDASTALEQVASLSGGLASPGAGADDGGGIEDPIDGPDHADAETSEQEEQTEGEGPARASISGHVLDDQGFPMQGAKVACVLRGPGDTNFTFTGKRMTYIADADGHFVFDRVGGREAYVSASALGFQNASTKVKISEGQSHDGLRLILSPGVTLLGNVVMASGAPVEGAIAQRLAFFYGGSGGSGIGDTYNVAITDKAGFFTMGFKTPGEVTLKVSAPGHAGAVFTETPVGLEEPIEFRLESPATLTGTITHADGAPAAGLQVKLQGQFSLSWTREGGKSGIYTGASDYLATTTGGDGRYRFESLATHAAYIASVCTRESSAALSFETDLGVFGPGEARIWDHVLEPMIRVTGSVTGETTGAPVTKVRISYRRDGEVTEGPYLFHENSYELRLFEAGTYYIFPEYNHFTRPLTMDKYGQEVTLAVGEEREVNFKMPDQFTMAIQVVDASGAPIPGATADWLRITPQGSGMYGWGDTDHEGRHSSTFVPDFESWFYVHKEGYTGAQSSHITGEPAAEYPEEVVVLYATGGVEGIALDSGGNPVRHAQLRVALRAEGVSVSLRGGYPIDFIDTTTDSEGAFAIGDGLPAILGDIYIQAKFEDTGWSAAAVVTDVECITGEVVNLGAVVFEEEQRQ